MDREIVVTANINTKAMFIEFFGSCFICFTAGLCAVNMIFEKGGAFPALTFTSVPCLVQGLCTCYFYMIGREISGAHFNPAVSLSFAITKKIDWMAFCIYVFFQLLGSLAGGVLISYMTPDSVERLLEASYPSPNTAFFNFWSLWGVETLSFRRHHCIPPLQWN